MNFASFPYLVFLCLSLVLFFLLKGSARHFTLLLISWFFYSFFGLGFVVLMLFTSALTFFCAERSFNSATAEQRQFFFWLGIVSDLSVLILFKYMHVMDGSIMSWPGWYGSNLLIPVGISFYTFKTLGYCIDVYKRRMEPEHSFVMYALSVSFFPQLIAGPIEKTNVIAVQLRKPLVFETQRVIEGGKLILWGLFKKLVIADSIGSAINPVFADIHHYKGIDLLFVQFAFVYQVYADFSGYSDIAIGSARCFGVELPANFNKPFFSKDYADFWRRWHITLGNWIKNYIYIPLGGNRVKSNFRLYFNLFVIFLLMGLWHGASLNFILFGLTALVWVLLGKATAGIRNKIFGTQNNGLAVNIFRYVSNFVMLISITIFFRMSEPEGWGYFLKNVFHVSFPSISALVYVYTLAFILLFELLQWGQLRANGHCFEGIKNTVLRLGLYLFMIFLLILFSSRPDTSFQYFQF